MSTIFDRMAALLARLEKSHKEIAAYKAERAAFEKEFEEFKHEKETMETQLAALEKAEEKARARPNLFFQCEKTQLDTAKREFDRRQTTHEENLNIYILILKTVRSISALRHLSTHDSSFSALTLPKILTTPSKKKEHLFLPTNLQPETPTGYPLSTSLSNPQAQPRSSLSTTTTVTTMNNNPNQEETLKPQPRSLTADPLPSSIANLIAEADKSKKAFEGFRKQNEKFDIQIKDLEERCEATDKQIEDLGERCEDLRKSTEDIESLVVILRDCPRPEDPRSWRSSKQARHTYRH
ncbi:MAG: hypothetical protein Q9218_006462 [Villophora microphyllina]